MIVALIEKVYGMLWGDLIHIPLPGRKHIGNFAFDYFTDSYRNLFYNRTRFMSLRMLPDMVRALVERKKEVPAFPRFRR